MEEARSHLNQVAASATNRLDNLLTVLRLFGIASRCYMLAPFAHAGTSAQHCTCAGQQPPGAGGSPCRQSSAVSAANQCLNTHVVSSPLLIKLQAVAEHITVYRRSADYEGKTARPNQRGVMVQRSGRKSMQVLGGPIEALKDQAADVCCVLDVPKHRGWRWLNQVQNLGTSPSESGLVRARET